MLYFPIWLLVYLINNLYFILWHYVNYLLRNRKLSCRYGRHIFRKNNQPYFLMNQPVYRLQTYLLKYFFNISLLKYHKNYRINDNYQIIFMNSLGSYRKLNQVCQKISNYYSNIVVHRFLQNLQIIMKLKVQVLFSLLFILN